MFRTIEGEISQGDLSNASSQKDSIVIMYDYINFETDITENSSLWNIVYMDSATYSNVSNYEYEDLLNKGKKVEMVIKSEKISDNEWLCKKILDIEIVDGITSIID
jgi:hypothetical protein